MEITLIHVLFILLGFAIGFIAGQLKVLLIKQHVLDLMEAKAKTKKKAKTKRKTPPKKKATPPKARRRKKRKR